MFYIICEREDEENNAHNMFLLLDLRFKNVRLMSSFIGLEQSKAIVEEYDRKDLECHVVKMLSSFAPLD